MPMALCLGTIPFRREVLKLPVAFYWTKSTFNEDLWILQEIATASPDKLQAFERKILPPARGKSKIQIAMAWDERYALLEAFKEQKGHCNVPYGNVVEGVKLGRWVANQRTRTGFEMWPRPSAMENCQCLMLKCRGSRHWDSSGAY